MASLLGKAAGGLPAFMDQIDPNSVSNDAGDRAAARSPAVAGEMAAGGYNGVCGGVGGWLDAKQPATFSVPSPFPQHMTIMT